MVKQSRCVSEAIYGCDNCKSEIVNYINEENRLEMAIFKIKIVMENVFIFCSWNCVLEYIPKIKSNYFVASLPYLYFEKSNINNINANELIKILKTIKNKK